MPRYRRTHRRTPRISSVLALVSQLGELSLNLLLNQLDCARNQTSAAASGRAEYASLFRRDGLQIVLTSNWWHLGTMRGNLQLHLTRNCDFLPSLQYSAFHIPYAAGVSTARPSVRPFVRLFVRSFDGMKRRAPRVIFEPLRTQVE